MDESISFFSFSFDQVIVDGDSNAINSFEYVSLEQSCETNSDRTFYVVEANQYDVIDQLGQPEENIELLTNNVNQSFNNYNTEVNSYDNLRNLSAKVKSRNEEEDKQKFIEQTAGNSSKENNVEDLDNEIPLTEHETESTQTKDDLQNFLDRNLSEEVTDSVKERKCLDDMNKVWINGQTIDSQSSKSPRDAQVAGSNNSTSRLHRCSQCARVFKVVSRLKSHIMSVHMKCKPHKCDICPEAFFRASDLRKHFESHIGLKKYSCGVCSKKFTDSSNLKRHMSTHTKAKPYACAVCGKRYAQLSNLKRHRTDSASAIYGSCAERYSCGVCGEEFYQRELLDQHEKTHEDISHNMSDLGRNVDALIRNILNEEIIQTNENNGLESHIDNISENTIENIVNETIEHNTDNFEIELINEIDRLECLEEAHSNQNEFNMQTDFFINDSNYTVPEKVVCNVNLTNKEIDINYSENITKDNTHIMKLEDECATIFESDVDLESSVNLAANLNQLIAENNVEFVSTEDDDTFIINLSSAIDAEQLSDLLNIGIEVIRTDVADTEEINEEKQVVKDIKVKVKKKKMPKLYHCKICQKTFQTKNNYTSHLGVHNDALCKYECSLCKKKFAYKSTLNKHHKRVHIPIVFQCYPCDICNEKFKHKWMVKNHKEKDHKNLTPFHCSICTKKFYKRSDFVYHLRRHQGIRPYKCSMCNKRFMHASHRAKHKRHCAMAKVCASKDKQ